MTYCVDYIHIHTTALYSIYSRQRLHTLLNGYTTYRHLTYRTAPPNNHPFPTLTYSCTPSCVLWYTATHRIENVNPSFPTARIVKRYHDPASRIPYAGRRSYDQLGTGLDGYALGYLMGVNPLPLIPAR